MRSFSYRIQEEREERHKLKKLVRSGADPGGGGSPMMQDRPVRFDPMDGQPGRSAGDKYECSTWIFLGLVGAEYWPISN